MSCCMSTLGLLRMTEPAVFGYNMSYVHKWSSNCCTTFACLHCKHNTTQHNTTQHNTTQHNTTQHNTTQPNPTQHNTTQHNTTQHNTTQHNTTQHNTTQHNTKSAGSCVAIGGTEGGGGYFSGPCWACVNTTQEGVGGYFLPLCWPAVLTRLISPTQEISNPNNTKRHSRHISQLCPNPPTAHAVSRYPPIVYTLIPSPHEWWWVVLSNLVKFGVDTAVVQMVVS